MKTEIKPVPDKDRGRSLPAVTELSSIRDHLVPVQNCQGQTVPFGTYLLNRATPYDMLKPAKCTELWR